MTLNFIYDPTHFVPYSFFDTLPILMRHHSPSQIASIPALHAHIKSTCPCPGSCHERPYALWPRAVSGLIRPLITAALRNYLDSYLKISHPTTSPSTTNNINIINNFTAVQDGDYIHIPNTNTDNNNRNLHLPLIPDVAIHYRCSDNFVGHYGFLPFKAFLDIVPPHASTIYVLAENRDRKNVHKKYLPPKCDAIFNAMFSFLKAHFPQVRDEYACVCMMSV